MAGLLYTILGSRPCTAICWQVSKWQQATTTTRSNFVTGQPLSSGQGPTETEVGLIRIQTDGWI
eukprot:7806073-Prorocentrum_lima.AAC.1